MLKTCFKCSQEKPRTEFYRHPQMGDGLLGKCKECARTDVRANRAARTNHYKEFDRQRANLPHRVAARKLYNRTEDGRAAHRRALQKQRQIAPHKNKARQAVSNAIRTKKILPMPCIVCGADAEAHHPDYSQPLYVIWLCDKHHKEVHKAEREARRMGL